MPKLSERIARLEAYLGEKISERFPKLKERKKRYIAIGLGAWYLYGMLVNSVRLGIRSTFGDGDGHIWVLNPFRNLLALFTAEGVVILAVGFLLVCLITKKGYVWFSGYKFTKDPRGFDILPDGTHGSSGFMTRKELESVLDCKPVAELDGTVFGKYKATPTLDDKYAKYVSLKDSSALNDHTLVYGASGTGKSRGFVRPFAWQAVRRRESMLLVDPKGEFYESMSEYFRANDYTVKVFNLLDMENSDGFNVMRDIDADINLVASIADVVIKNTANGREQPSDFWDKAELNLLMALIHYVQSQEVPGTDRLLPIEQRSLGTIYKMLSRETFNQLEERFAKLPKTHPAQGTYGIFKLAPRNLWGNIATGLGTRLTVFQNELVDKITSYDEIDMTLPGQRPCAYFCVIPDQENPYEFLSSLFFSTLFSRLTDYARRFGERGRLPVAVNVCLDEFCNIGDFGFKRLISTVRSRNINCQVLVQGVSQLENRYPRNEWQEIVANCDCQIYLGGNDNLTAKYISEKCGKVTIAVKNNQMPLTPLFSPIYSSTRPYSQTKSNTQRDLMQPDEVLRLPNEQCLVMLRGQKPLLLHKIVPEEFSGYADIRAARITDYVPLWRQTPTEPQPIMAPVPAEPVRVPIVNDDTRVQEPVIPPAPAETDYWKTKTDYTLVQEETDNKYGPLIHMGETSPTDIIDETINKMGE
ncbi:MAG: type IV secretory system conjugative DNA transfer family protein [Oscillospiraceae bacterium]|jgi:type IV secretion system protein VirD4|nr:type IV secretory system conjugative DNA transfer family protein [Oscillospiraceae bacterium]